MVWSLPGDPAILTATQGRNICLFGEDKFFRDDPEEEVDIDELLLIAAIDFLHTK